MVHYKIPVINCMQPETSTIEYKVILFSLIFYTPASYIIQLSLYCNHFRTSCSMFITVFLITSFATLAYKRIPLAPSSISLNASQYNLVHWSYHNEVGHYDALNLKSSQHLNSRGNKFNCNIASTTKPAVRTSSSISCAITLAASLFVSSMVCRTAP